MSGYGANPRGGGAGAADGQRWASRQEQLGGRYQPFSNPFFDQAATYTPTTVKELFSFCRHFHLTHGLINAINSKAAEYPITDIVFQDKDAQTVNRYESLFDEQLNYPVTQYGINLDHYVYGIAFVSVMLPFEKMLTCGACRTEHSARRTRPNWRYTGGKFWLDCPKCGQGSWARADDRYQRKLSEISVMRWNPEYMTIFQNEVTGREDYVLDLSPGFRRQVQLGRKDLVATTPEVFLEAVRMHRHIVLDPRDVFVLRRPGISQTMGGWGIPLLLPVLKDAYYLQIMKKAQESVLLQHLIPQIFLFPQPSTAGADPYITSNLADWASTIRTELSRQRRDPAYYGLVPFPLGHQVIGENGRSLLLMPEIMEMSKQICMGMGFPVDLMFGSGTYAGNSVNMRMLENFFLSNVRGHARLLRFVINKIATFMSWPVVAAKFKPFKMADDLQRQAFMFSLNQAKKISDTTLLAYSDLKVDTETELQIREVGIRSRALRESTAMETDLQAQSIIGAAKAQAKAQEVMAESQAKAMQPKINPFQDALVSATQNPAGVPLDLAAQALAEAVRVMPEARRQHYLNQLKDVSPDVSALLQQQAMMGGAAAEGAGGPPQAAGAGAGVDMRPMPEQLPPRRASLA